MTRPAPTSPQLVGAGGTDDLPWECARPAPITTSAIKRRYAGESEAHWRGRLRVLGSRYYLDPDDPGRFYDQLVGDLGGREAATRFVARLARWVGVT